MSTPVESLVDKANRERTERHARLQAFKDARFLTKLAKEFKETTRSRIQREREERIETQRTRNGNAVKDPEKALADFLRRSQDQRKAQAVVDFLNGDIKVNRVVLGNDPEPHKPARQPGKSKTVVVEFYCWVEGVIGTVNLHAQTPPAPL